MQSCVVFATPGLIPLESFTAFGVNAKPASTNPFGYFGTGLKYAIAVCLREGQEIVLWRGRDKYTFYAKDEDFRGKSFAYVRMKKETFSLADRLLSRPTYTKLPFTTELGKNWKLWQAFRELETNTRDENGKTAQEYWEDSSTHVHSDRTAICVYGTKFIDEFHDRNRNFLPEGKVLHEDDAVQVIDKPSAHIYYRGVRIVDLREEAEFTYNFLCHVDLTEDRTAMYPSYLEMGLADYIAQHDDTQFVGRAVNSRRYERHFNYSYTSRPSVAFLNTAADSPNPTARELVEKTKKAITPYSKIIISVPRSEITDEEKKAVQEAVEEIFGTEIVVEDIRDAA